jgi:YD repeat-containing protein
METKDIDIIAALREFQHSDTTYIETRAAEDAALIKLEAARLASPNSGEVDVTFFEWVEAKDATDAVVDGFWESDIIKHEPDEDSPITVTDSNGNVTFSEDKDGFWLKAEYDSNDNKIREEDNDGWICFEYDSDNRVISSESFLKKSFSEDQAGYRVEFEYDSAGKLSYSTQ